MPEKFGSTEIAPRLDTTLLLFSVMTMAPALLTAAPGWTVTPRPSWAPASKPVAEGPLQVTVAPVWMQSARAGLAEPMHRTIQSPRQTAARRRIPPDRPDVKESPNRSTPPCIPNYVHRRK